MGRDDHTSVERYGMTLLEHTVRRRDPAPMHADADLSAARANQCSGDGCRTGLVPPPSA